jgi:hypothetical protein
LSKLEFQTGDKKDDLTRLCEVGKEIYLERARRGWHPRFDYLGLGFVQA